MTKFGFFDSKEFECKDGTHSAWFQKHGVDVNPQLIDLMNVIRKEYGKPIVITSGYRSPDYNERVDGVKNSLHTLGQACDFRPLQKNMEGLKELQWIALKHNPHGGVGLYDSFVHVDIRGYQARWDNRTKK